MKKYALNLLLAVVLILIFSCEKNDSGDENAIHSTYELSYNKTTDQTLVSAIFRIGEDVNTSFELEDPAFSTFNGDILPYNVYTKAHEKKYAGKIGSGTFLYSDSEGHTYSNTSPEIDTIGIPGNRQINNNSVDYKFRWSGSPIAENETIKLKVELNGRTNDYGASAIGSTEITIPFEHIIHMCCGSAKFTISRVYTKLSLGDSTPGGGVMIVKYTTQNNVVIN